MKLPRKIKELNQKLDDKIMMAVVKDKKTLDDTVRQYEEKLKDENLSEKDKKQLEGLLITAKRVRKTFSDKEKKGSKEDKKEKEPTDKKRVAKELGAVAGGSGLVAGGSLLSRKLGRKAQSMLLEKDTEEGQKLLEKLKKVAEDQGTNVEHSIFGNSVYGSKGAHKLVDWIDKKDHDTASAMRRMIGKPGKAGDSINSVKKADIFAHELGHSKHFQGRDGSLIGKVAHKGIGVSKITTATPVGLALSAINGYSSGKRAAEAESKGEKESKWNKVRSVALPAIAATPMLTSEAAASLKGLKELKKAGASKAYLKSSGKNLALAFGTYAAVPLGAAGIGLASRGIGKMVTRKRLERKKKKEDK